MRLDFKITFTHHFHPIGCCSQTIINISGCYCGLLTLSIMVFSLGASRFYSMFIIQFSCVSGIFETLFLSFKIKNVFYYFLFIFQNFEVIINSNGVNCSYKLWMLWMTMKEQLTYNYLMPNFYYSSKCLIFFI